MALQLIPRERLVVIQKLLFGMAWGCGFRTLSCLALRWWQLLYIAHARFLFRWWPIKILKLLFGSAKGQEWGFVFVGLGDARYFFFVNVISLCLNAEGAPPRHAPRRLMADEEFATYHRHPRSGNGLEPLGGSKVIW